MTMDEFSKKTETETHVIIKVRVHKTFHKHGFAHVTLDKMLFSRLQLYVESFRPTFSRNDCEKVFISHSGRSMESGAVSRRVHKIWLDSDVYKDREPPKKNMCGNVIRKSMTTLVHQKRPGDKQAVADLLAHNIKTAEDIYRQKQMMNQAVRAAEAIKSVTRCNDSEASCSRFVCLDCIYCV